MRSAGTDDAVVCTLYKYVSLILTPAQLNSTSTNPGCSSDTCASGVESLVLPVGGTGDMGDQSAHWGSFKCSQR
jgi:hypothetical protein